MNVLVTGSRKWTDREAIFEVLDRLNPDVVIHGGALGADSIAHVWRKKHGRVAHVYFPDYSLGKGAPLARNKQMVKVADYVVGFPMTGSRGTWFTLSYAEKCGVEREIVQSA